MTNMTEQIKWRGLMTIKTLIVCFSTMLFNSCISDEPNQQEETSVLTTSGFGVFIGNEGNFQFSNASLSYVSDSMQHQGSLFSSNTDLPLGDVLQSLAQDETRMYLIVNNSGKIEVVDKVSLASVGTITGLVSPRNMQVVNNSKAYVSDLYGNAIAIVDLNTMQVSETIAVAGWTEEMLYYVGKVFVCAPKLNMIYVIDANSNLLLDSIPTRENPNSLVQDKYGQLWVLCGGDFMDEQTDAYVQRIDPNNLSLVAEQKLSEGGYAFDLSINRSKDSLLFVQTDIKVLPILSQGFGTEGVVYDGVDINIYAMEVNARDNTVWFADAKDYLQASDIKKMSTSGVVTGTVSAGINSGCFLFQ